MPSVDIDRVSRLDKIHVNRMLHAFAQLAIDLIRLEDGRVNSVLRHKGIAVFPGPIVGIEYGPGDRQILEVDLSAANKEVNAAPVVPAVKKPAPKRKAKK